MFSSVRKRIGSAKGNGSTVVSSKQEVETPQSLWSALSILQGGKMGMLLPKTKSDLQKALKGKSRQSRMYFIGGFFLLLVVVNVGLSYLHSLDGGAKKMIRLAATGFWVTMENWHVFRPLREFDLNYAQEYPELRVLEENYHIIREEAEGLLKIKDQLRPLSDVLNAGGIHKNTWTTFFLQVAAGDTIEENAKFAPKTAALIKDIPGVYTSFFSILEPHTKLGIHWGYFKGFVRYHLGVIIPNNNKDKTCWIRFNPDYAFNKTTEAAVTAGDKSMMETQEKYYWKDGEAVMFDDNYIHEAANESDEPRVVLFIDVARKMPWYANIVNKIMLFVAMNDNATKELRKKSIVQLKSD